MSHDIPIIKTFSDNPRVYVRAQQVWIILCARVDQMRLMASRTSIDQPLPTYGDLAEKMGHPRRAGVTLGQGPLGIVAWYCKLNNLPALNSIVVNNSGYPGDLVLLREGYTVEQEQADVLNTDWFQYRVPTTGTFRKVWEFMQRQEITVVRVGM